MFVFSTSLAVSNLEIETDKISGEIRLALVTDFHSCNYGKGQIELISAIDAERPDAVLLCGDIFDDNLPPKNTVELIENIEYLIARK